MTANPRPGRQRVRIFRRVRVWHLVAAVLIAGAAVPLMRLVELPSLVEEITVENPTRYNITIEVTDEGRDAWIAVGTVGRGTTSTFAQVIDQGDVWIFRLSAHGQRGGELRLTRQQIEADRWRIRIPQSVGEELQAKGAPFPP